MTRADVQTVAAGIYPGIAVCMIIAVAAMGIAGQYGAPVMLIALLVGLALHPLSQSEVLAPGIHISAKTILKIGVALLGLRIAYGDIASLGWMVPLCVIAIVALTILVGSVLGRWLGLSAPFAVLASGAVAICGVSAAVAISCVLPKREGEDRQLSLVIAGVMSLSTVAMILYPVIAARIGLSDPETGFFLGGSIHDVAQVVGAGYSVSPEAGDAATYVKLLRVSLLLPVVVLIGFFFRDGSDAKQTKWTSLVPLFLIGFILLAVVNSFHLIPPKLLEVGNSVSRFFIITSLVAVGMRTDLRDLARVGPRPLIALTLATAIMAIAAAATVATIHPIDAVTAAHN